MRCVALVALLISGCTTPPRPVHLAAAGDPDPLRTGLDALTPEILKDYLGTLASDAYEGRCAGFPGNDKAALYIAARMKEAGLKPVGAPDVSGDPTYFQPFLFDQARHITRNCVGLLEGSDPKLKDEIVVIGAHFDHVGVKGQHKAGQLGRAEKDDVIWNGADDNGSGTTTVLGVLKIFAIAKARPRRSVLFIWFSAEEWGLYGSKWYCDHPIFPLDKTVAMLNLDMTGRTDDETVANCYGVGTAMGDVFRPVVERAMQTTDGFKLNIDANYGGGSDHCSFADKKVPVCGFGEKGPCPDYHRVSDHPDRIKYAYMVAIAKAAAVTLHAIACMESRPRWNTEFKLPPPVNDGKPRLGVYLSALEEDELTSLKLEKRGALRANDVIADGVGAASGLLKNDVIIGLDGKSFDLEYPRETLMEILEKVVRGREYVIEVVRGGATLELKATWPESKKP